MSFRAPRFCHAHAFRERGIANLSLGTGSAASGFPLDNLIDDRVSLQFKLSTTGPLELECDLGASFVADGLSGLDRLIIPAGHNINKEVLVEQDTGSGFASPETLATFTPTTGVQVDEAIVGHDERFIRINIVDTTKAWEMSEVVFTKIVTLAAGPDLGDADDEPAHNFERLSYKSGASPTVQQGAAQRVFELEYPSLDNVYQGGTDLTKMKALIDDVGMSKPFWVDPVSFSATPATDDPPIWMKFAREPRSWHMNTVPAEGIEKKRYALSLIESLD